MNESELQMSDKLVIYHRSCFDGFCGAWLFHKIFPNAEYYAAQYGEVPPNVKDKVVYMVDFSYKLPIMLNIIKDAKAVTVLDHHKTAEAELGQLTPKVVPELDYQTGDESLQKKIRNLQIKFDMNKSGAHIAWDYLWKWYAPKMFSVFPLEGRDRMHWLVEYTEDHDLWVHKLPNTFEIKAALKLAPFDFSKWDEYAKWRPDDLVPAGRNILQYQKVLVDQHVRNAREMVIAGHHVLVVNATVLFSDIAGELSKGRDFGACYFDRDDGIRQFSLRSRDEGIDVSEVAKKFGGGGHFHAAGFEIKSEDMDKLNG